jgi:hypothetical protein
MWTLLYYGVAGILVLMVLLWTLLPMAQHAVDRTFGFWMFWGLIEIALIAFFILVYRKRK